VIRVADDPERPGGAEGEVPAEPEVAEIRRRKKYAIRAELSQRSGGAPEDEGFEEPSREDGFWKPPAEMAAAPRRTGLLRRTLFFALLLAGAWLVMRTVTTFVFTPEITMGEVQFPVEVVEPGDPILFEVMARNRSAARGEIFPVLVLGDGSELAGPPVEVPGRDSARVLVSEVLPPGDHVVSILLYDAWQEDRRLGSAHGIPVRVGAPSVEVSDGAVPARVAEGARLSIAVTLVNRTSRLERLTPVAVFELDPGPGNPVEVAGPELAISGLETVESRIEVSTTGLPPGRYRLSVVLVTAGGDRAGSGLHGSPVQIEGHP
jgi:hypothetical protein